MKTVHRLIVFCCFGIAALGQAVDDPRWVINYMIDRLTRQDLPQAERARFEAVIVAQQVHAIPVLIDHLTDQRAVGVISHERGECMNLPPHQPAPTDCIDTETKTVAMLSEDLLYRIITPTTLPAGCHKVHKKAWRTQPVYIANWPRWWKSYRRQSITAIRAATAKRIEQFCQAGGHSSVEW